MNSSLALLRVNYAQNSFKMDKAIIFSWLVMLYGFLAQVVMECFKRLQPFCHYRLTNSRQFVNNAATTPHCVGRFGDLLYTRRMTAFSVFFMRAVQLRPRYDRLNGDIERCAGSCVPVRQPRSVCPPSLATWLMDLQSTHKRSYIMATGFETRGTWCLKLPNPYRNTQYLPIDTKQLAQLLDISERTALRICKGESKLSKAELVFLQIHFFGYIPDPLFSRHKIYIYEGQLKSLNNDDFAVNAGELTEFALLGGHYRVISQEYEAAKKRIAELECPPKPQAPSNIIDFQQVLSKRQNNNLGA